MTPAAKTNPLVRTAAGCFFACSTKPIALMDSTGNTQGIRFRIRPPSTASIMSTGSAGGSEWPATAAATGAAAGAATERGAPVAFSVAAISMGTVRVSLPLCSLASNTPRTVPVFGG